MGTVPQVESLSGLQKLLALRYLGLQTLHVVEPYDGTDSAGANAARLEVYDM
jgi:hypothetical protein